jgi:two-component system response regulator HydG
MTRAPQSVLIVDDNENLARTMSFVLRRKGYAPDIALDGGEAIARLEARAFDVVLMDIKMPRVDGVEACRKIKQLRPETLVVMMTAYSHSDKVQQALEQGAHSVVYKPLDLERVITLIEQAVDGDAGVLVMVVDDQEGTRLTLEKILARRGCTVTVASSGEEALELARQRRHDIFLLDMKLPRMDGLQTYLAIKEISPQADVMVMTGYREEMADKVQGALRACAHTCLNKPIDLENLLTIVDDIGEKRRRSDADG